MAKAPPSPAPSPAGWFRVEVEVALAAPPERVWKAIVAETSAWWTGDFLVAGPGSRFVVDPRPGGRMVELRADGTGLLWFHVVASDPPRRLEFAGEIFPAWGGPARTQVTLALEPVRRGTRLVLTDSVYGNATEALRKALDAGWRTLFGTMLPAHLERRRRARAEA